MTKSMKIQDDLSTIRNDLKHFRKMHEKLLTHSEEILYTYNNKVVEETKDWLLKEYLSEFITFNRKVEATLKDIGLKKNWTLASYSESIVDNLTDIASKLPNLLGGRLDRREYDEFLKQMNNVYGLINKYLNSIEEEMIEAHQSLYTNVWDLFISHATEDKEELVRPLANALVNAGYKVWYDEFELKLGDSLRRSLDDGIHRSKYGLVVLSKNFFIKKWTNLELDALITKFSGDNVLPVWHNVSSEDVKKYSPILATFIGVKTSDGLDAIVRKVREVVIPSS